MSRDENQTQRHIGETKPNISVKMKPDVEVYSHCTQNKLGRKCQTKKKKQQQLQHNDEHTTNNKTEKQHVDSTDSNTKPDSGTES